MAEIRAIFVELGFGNRRWLESEVEFDNGRERRVAGCLPLRVREIYLRCWLGHRVWVLSSRSSLNSRRKPRRAFKLLLGLGGVDRRVERKT